MHLRGLLRLEHLDGPARGSVHSLPLDDSLALDIDGACRTLALTPSRAVLLTCEQGSLWVTLRHDTRDYLLTSGASIIAPRNSLPIVNANRGGRLRVSLNARKER